MIVIRKMAPIHLILHRPETAEAQAELARRVAVIHANAVIRQLKSLNCPAARKLELLETVAANAKRTESPCFSPVDGV